MALRLTVQDAGVYGLLSRLQSQLRDMTPVYKAMGSKLERNVQVRFDTKEDPNGNPWKAWAPSTAAARAREGRGTLLEYTGRMRASLTHLATNQSVEVGFGVPYAVYHEESRPLLFADQNGLSDDDMRDAMDAAQRAFRRALKLQNGP